MIFDWLFYDGERVRKQAVYWQAYAQAVKEFAKKHPTFPVIPPAYIPEVWEK